MRHALLGLLAVFMNTVPAVAEIGLPKLKFVTVTPCRVVDTRLDPNNPLFVPAPGPTTRVFPVTGVCGVPAGAKAFSLNVTAVPLQTLSYLTIWPTGEPQPLASLLNSWSGAVVASAAIVKAGADGSVSIFTTDFSHVVIDINGYFVESATDLEYHPVAQCRVLDSRKVASLVPLFSAGSTRRVDMTGVCGLPANAKAYSLNFTVVPSQPLGYLATWPSGAPKPLVSTLNAPEGSVVANAAVVAAGAGAAIDVFVTGTTDVIIDVNGYFAQPAEGGLSLYIQNSCRVADTRVGQGAVGTLGPPALAGGETRLLDLRAGRCGVPPGTPLTKPEQIAYVLNATVVTSGPLGFLSLWPFGPAWPNTSTLNSSALGIAAVSNMVIVEGNSSSGEINVLTTNAVDLVLDLNGYFAR